MTNKEYEFSLNPKNLPGFPLIDINAESEEEAREKFIEKALEHIKIQLKSRDVLWCFEKDNVRE